MSFKQYLYNKLKKYQEDLIINDIIIMNEVIVYLKEDYSINESLFVDEKLEKDEITKIVNDKFNIWYFYDIE